MDLLSEIVWMFICVAGIWIFYALIVWGMLIYNAITGEKKPHIAHFLPLRWYAEALKTDPGFADLYDLIATIVSIGLLCMAGMFGYCYCQASQTTQNPGVVYQQEYNSNIDNDIDWKKELDELLAESPEPIDSYRRRKQAEAELNEKKRQEALAKANATGAVGK